MNHLDKCKEFAEAYITGMLAAMVTTDASWIVLKSRFGCLIEFCILFLMILLYCVLYSIGSFPL